MFGRDIANIYKGGRLSRKDRPDLLSTPLEKTDAATGNFVRFEKIINVENQTAAFSG